MSLALQIMVATGMAGAPDPGAPETKQDEAAPQPSSFEHARPEAPLQGPGRDDEATAVRLVWDAPPSCSDESSMQARLDETMRLTLEDEPASRSRWVIARVRKEESGWSLRLWVPAEGVLSERSLSESSCEELERATLTIVAMLMPPVMIVPESTTPPPKAEDFNPGAELEPLGAEGLDALIGDPEPEPPPPPDPGGPDMEPPPASQLWGAIGFAGGGGRGEMPVAGGGGRITAALVFPVARLEFSGSYWRSRTVGLSLTELARARYSFVSAMVRGCGAPNLTDRIELSVCGGVEAGSVMANVDGAALLHGAGQPAVLVNVSTGLHVALLPTVVLTFGAETWIAALKARHRAFEGQLPDTRRLGWRMLAGVEFRFGGRRKARAFESRGKAST